MNIALEDGNIVISTASARVVLHDDGVQIGDFIVDFPGEYEHSQIFVEAREVESWFVFIMTIESRTMIFLTSGVNPESLSLKDINDKDIVIFPARDAVWKVVETWEASIVLPYGDQARALLQKIGQNIESESSLTFKGADFESETVRYVLLGI